jgi:hypothetical protein
MMLWLGVANSFALDFLARKKAALNLTLTIMDSLPLPRAFEGTGLPHVPCVLLQRGQKWLNFGGVPLECLASLQLPKARWKKYLSESVCAQKLTCL